MSDAYDRIDARIRGWVEERDFSGIAAVHRTVSDGWSVR